MELMPVVWEPALRSLGTEGLWFSDTLTYWNAGGNTLALTSH